MYCCVYVDCARKFRAFQPDVTPVCRYSVLQGERPPAQLISVLCSGVESAVHGGRQARPTKK